MRKLREYQIKRYHTGADFHENKKKKRQVVTKTEEGLAVAYGNIVALLIESVKELSE